MLLSCQQLNITRGCAILYLDFCKPSVWQTFEELYVLIHLQVFQIPHFTDRTASTERQASTKCEGIRCLSKVEGCFCFYPNVKYSRHSCRLCSVCIARRHVAFLVVLRAIGTLPDCLFIRVSTVLGDACLCCRWPDFL